jgi:peptidoglycan/LPS O-acetylase OafA/YrhL
VTTAPVSAPAPARTSRLGHVDDLKVALTVGVVTAHAAITYGAQGSWFYREVPDDDPGALGAVLTVPLALGAIFGMGLFFFLAGAFTPAALDRKGTRRFLADRWLRLGVPFALFVLLVVPLTQWLSDAGSGQPTSAADQVRTQLGDFDAGPLWFVGVLLVYSTVYALVARPAPAAPAGELTGRLVVLCMAGVAAATFVLRLWFPIDSAQPFAAHVWQWGQCAGLFVLGLHAGRQGWFTRIPGRLRVRCAWALAAGAVAVVALVGANADDLDPLAGGVGWQPAAVALTEGVMATAAAIALTDLFRNRRRGRVAVLAGEAAYGAYIVQAPVLVALAVLLRDSPLPAAARFGVVAVTGVLACFATAAALRRIPGVRGIL